MKTVPTVRLADAADAVGLPDLSEGVRLAMADIAGAAREELLAMSVTPRLHLPRLDHPDDQRIRSRRPHRRRLVTRHLEGHRIFRELLAQGGGTVNFDADQREFTFQAPNE